MPLWMCQCSTKHGAKPVRVIPIYGSFTDQHPQPPTVATTYLGFIKGIKPESKYVNLSLISPS